MSHLYNLSAYQYELPKELIAQFPLKKRDESRLMIVDRASGNLSEMRFRDLLEWAEEGDQFIFNDTKVVKARLVGNKETGAAVEIFLLKNLEQARWEVLCKPGRKVKKGHRIVFGDSFHCEIEATLENGHKIVRFDSTQDFGNLLQKYGTLPLPHYMDRDPEAEDELRYQTVYAKEKGALAAPTAGLHFTQDLLSGLKTKGAHLQILTLHVGLGTFKPVQTDDIRSHSMHSEFYKISSQTARHLNHFAKRQICVGTTTCRALESCASGGKIYPGKGRRIYLYIPRMSLSLSNR